MINSRLASSLKVKFLGIIPNLRDETGSLSPQQIVSLSALLTFKGKSIKDLLKESQEKGENLEEKIIKIVQKSSLRGHASIATTPALCFTYEGSKFLDSALTGIIFSSSLMSSGRRTKTSEDDIIFPDKIFSDEKAREIYEATSKKIIRFFNSLLEKEIRKDEASKILQYGIYGTGIIQLPIESIVLLKREYLKEKESMPEEVGILLGKIENNLKSFGVDLLYASRVAAPRNVYSYPNIFKDSKKSNLVRELRKKENLSEGSKIISIENLIPQELKNKLLDLENKRNEIFSSKERIKQDWPNLLAFQQEIIRDYNLAFKIKVLSSVPWRVWGEKKRHRTCPQVIESVYFCIERAAKRFENFKDQIQKKQINKEIVKEIEEVFSIPPSIKQNQGLLEEYLSVALSAFDSYQALIRLGIKLREAIFVIPRAVKIDILQEYDLYNLLAGYYPLRLCQTAEEEMRRNTKKEVAQLKELLSENGCGWLNKLIVPKCEIVGFCPEEKSCGNIEGRVGGYDEEFHQEMKQDLKKRFEENLENLEK
ncbi:FAD-dependent thymidylate synthase [Patescibacteria group bacterium]|nr:FAD-dependent thymidylate synthase [Patescibacteria group bacterium]